MLSEPVWKPELIALTIPADCGATMLQQNFEGELNSIEMFYEYKTNGYPKHLNYGTWKSEIHIFANIQEWRDLEKAILDTAGVPEPSYKLHSR
ncbi:unnamed protein product [Allacma fusca]|uniref:Uncharacterized protein n=1 Tax=Allacma fusca TaxID=39272 RepID=A0A8J2KU59_9HEXA|nr:unnamed protein product [Allacma fusca]